MKKFFIKRRHDIILLFYNFAGIFFAVYSERSLYLEGKDSGGFSMFIPQFIAIPCLLLHVVGITFLEKIPEKDKIIFRVLKFNFAMYFIDIFLGVIFISILLG